MYCRNCGQKLAEGDKFCSACGGRTILTNEIDDQSELIKNIELAADSKGATEEPASSFDLNFFGEKASQKNTKTEVTKDLEKPADDFDWNIHTFPGGKVEQTDEIDFRWTTEMLEKAENKKAAGDKAESTKDTIGGSTDFFAEAFNKVFDETKAPEPQEPEVEEKKPFLEMDWSGSAEEPEEPEGPKASENLTEQKDEPNRDALEDTLFSGLESKTDEARKQAEQIDKFFTFNQKNEEFQKLLDQEYEKIKSGNILEDEKNTAEAEAEEKFAARMPEDPMEELFAREGIIKGYQPKEVTSDVLERIDAAEAEKAAKEAHMAMLEEQKAKAEAEAAQREAARQAARAEAEAAIKAAEEKAAKAKEEAAARLAKQEAKLRAEAHVEPQTQVPEPIWEPKKAIKQMPMERKEESSQPIQVNDIMEKNETVNETADPYMPEFTLNEAVTEAPAAKVIEDTEFPKDIKDLETTDFSEGLVQPEITPAADHISEMAKAREAYFTEHEPLEINLDDVISDKQEEPPVSEQTRAFDKAAILAGMTAATKVVSKEDLAKANNEPQANIELPDFLGHDMTEADQEQVRGNTGPQEPQQPENMEQTQIVSDKAAEDFFNQVANESNAVTVEQQPEMLNAETPNEKMFDVDQAAEVQPQMQDQPDFDDFNADDKFSFMAENNDDFYEEQEEKGSKGRTVLKVLLVILILLLVIEIAGVVIRVVAPTSAAGEFINNQLNKVIHLFTGDDNQYNVMAFTEDIRTTPVENKTSMIKDQLDKNKDNNIKSIVYNSKLKLDPGKEYKSGDLALTQNLTDFAWYKDANNNQKYYDEEIVATIIAYESQRVNLANNNDRSVLSMMKPGTDLYKEIKRSAKKESKTTFNTLEIGEIREAGSAFYVWVGETIETTTGGSTGENKVYQLQPEENRMIVVASYDV